MTPPLRRTAVLLALAAATSVACGDRDSARDRAGASADSASPASPSSAPATAAAPAPGAAAPATDPAGVGPITDADVRAYRLEMETVRKWAQAGRNVREVVDAYPQLERGVAPGASLTDAMTEQLSQPQIAEAVRRAGIAPRDFVMVSAKLPLAYAANDLRERDPAMAQRLASPDALEFVRANEAELRRIFQELQIVKTRGGS